MKRFLPLLVLALGLGACSPTIKGSMALHSKDYDQAISLYQEALKENPSNTRASSLLGQAYYRKGLNQEAVNALEPLMTRHPIDPDAPIFLGLAYLALGERDKGFGAFERFESFIYRERRNVLTETARFRNMETLNLAEVESALYQAILDGYIEEQQMKAPDD